MAAAPSQPLLSPAGPCEASRPSRLEGVLRELGSRVQRGARPEEPGGAGGRWPTGVAALDRLLGGGLPRGRLTEITGPASSGRTSLALALLARATHAGGLAALVDRADAFDPPSAAAAGVNLTRVLWVRAPGARQALRAAEHVLAVRGIPLVLIDGLELAPSVHALTRLRKAAAGAQAALVVLGDARRTGSFSDVALDLSRARPRFTGSPPLFEGLEGTMHVARSRIGPTFEPVAVQWPAQTQVRSAAAHAQRAAGERNALRSVRTPNRTEAA